MVLQQVIDNHRTTSSNCDVFWAVSASGKSIFGFGSDGHRMPECSAPGKVILFGEHAVVFGKPALALAIDLRITSSVTSSSQFSVNGHPMKKRHHAYISAALDEAWGGPPINVDTESEIPAGSGLGSSAAVTVSCIASILASKGKLEPEKVARMSFEVESNVQGRASP